MEETRQKNKNLSEEQILDRKEKAYGKTDNLKKDIAFIK